MPDIVAFHPELHPPTIEILDPVGNGDIVVDVQEIYSEWKDWNLSDAARLGYPPSLLYRGKDPTNADATEFTGTTYFLLPPWKIRPAERNHRLTLVGNLKVPDGTSPIIPTLSSYTVVVAYETSNLVDEVAVPTTATAEIIRTVEDWGVINFAK